MFTNSSSGAVCGVFFFSILKRLFSKFILCFSFVFFLYFVFDSFAMYKIDGINVLSFIEFVVFELGRCLSGISNVMQFILIVPIIWVVVGLIHNLELCVMESAGVSKVQIFFPFFIFVIFVGLFHLFILNSLCIKLFNNSDAIYYSLGKDSKTIFSRRLTSPDVTLVKKIDDQSIDIIYLDKAYYNAENPNMVFIKKAEIVQYRSGEVTWLGYEASKIVRFDNNKSYLSTNKDDPDKVSIDLNIDFNLLLNKIDIERKDVFLFPFTSLIKKIKDLKGKKLTYNVFEYQLYSIIKSVLQFFVLLFLCVYFLCSIDIRVKRSLPKIVLSLSSYLVCFVFAQIFSSISSQFSDSFTMMVLNVVPSIIMSSIFIYCFIKKYA